jgi:DNA-binding beta-propeller fold protein YncE
VDGVGNVYVAMTASNQVWKFNPTDTSFQADTNFGIGGFIGITNGVAGTNTGEFNGPYDVAVSPDGQTISVSDSGNNRIQQFSATNGAFVASFGSQGSAVGQFNTPKGLTYDALGTLYIVDSGNNRLVLVEGSTVMDVTGSGGSDLGQFSGAKNVSISKRGVYVADTGNGRIQKFDLPAQGLFEITAGNMGYALSTDLSSPASVAAVNDLITEKFYVADTGHNRVLLCQVPDSNADALQAVWHAMTTNVLAGNIFSAVSYFSIASAEDYRQTFLAAGVGNTISAISQIGTLTPLSINNDTAEYYFTNAIDGQIITFPVKFDKENGVWKIVEF